MTNEPSYDSQLTNAEYWKKINRFDSLPGSSKSKDRFVRASFYANEPVSTSDSEKARAIVFSIIRNVSVPLDIKPDSSSEYPTTIWRSVADHKNRIYYFEDVRYLNSLMWLNLKEIDFSEKKGMRKLEISKPYNGNIYGQFVSGVLTPEIKFPF